MNARNDIPDLLARLDSKGADYHGLHVLAEHLLPVQTSDSDLAAAYRALICAEAQMDDDRAYMHALD